MPVATVEPTVMLIDELPEPGAGMGLVPKLKVTPLGWPEAVRVTAELNPPKTAVVIVVDPPLPWATLRDEGEAEILKVAAPVTVSVTVVFCCTPPPLPVTVIG